MSLFNSPVCKAEWEQAEEHFKTHPKTILRPNSSRQGIENIAHTFIDFGSVKVVCDNNENSKNLGAGTFGEVVLTKDRHDKLYAVKKQRRITEYLLEEQIEDIRLESDINNDLGIGLGRTIIERKNTGIDSFYNLQHYLGESLANYLKCNIKKMSDEQRWNMAILICLELARLHTGLLSKSYTRYAHLDIKPSNIVVDKQRNPHFIDFGFTEKMTWNKEKATQKSTRAYQSLDYFGQNKNHVDTFALKRTIYLPSTFKVRSGDRDDDCKYSIWDEKRNHNYYRANLITEEEVDRDKKLQSTLCTARGLTKDTTSAFLASSLLEAKHRKKQKIYFPKNKLLVNKDALNKDPLTIECVRLLIIQGAQLAINKTSDAIKKRIAKYLISIMNQHKRQLDYKKVLLVTIRILSRHILLLQGRWTDQHLSYVSNRTTAYLAAQKHLNKAAALLGCSKEASTILSKKRSKCENYISDCNYDNLLWNISKNSKLIDKPTIDPVKILAVAA